MVIDKFFIYKFLKFCVVGFSGVIIDFGITFLCKEKVRLNKYLSNAAGFVTAATSNYILNRIWTFQSSNEQVATEYGTFMLVSVIGLGINSLVLYLLNEKMRWNFYAIGVTTIWNFLANMVFTFR